MRVDEVLPLREQALYPASGGAPFLPGVEEFLRAMNWAGVRMAVATSSPALLLEAKSAGKKEFFAMLEGVVCGDDVQCGKPDPGIL
jgi:beta-phosphoglucomutase-like phosphatase (HAD superfamily)